MIDTKTRDYLNKERPLRNFRYTVKEKIKKYNCSQEEAYELIIGSSSRANQAVNKSLNL